MVINLQRHITCLGAPSTVYETVGRGVSFMSYIPGEKFLITDIDVFVDEDGYIHIRQEADPSYEDAPNVVLIDRSRALAVLRALQAAVSEQSQEEG